MVEGLPQLLELGRFGNHNQMLFEDLIIMMKKETMMMMKTVMMNNTNFKIMVLTMKKHLVILIQTYICSRRSRDSCFNSSLRR